MSKSKARAAAKQKDRTPDNIVEQVYMYGYAAIEDIRGVWEENDPYPKAVYQHYANIIAASDKQKPCLTAIFTIPPEVKMFLVNVYNNFIIEMAQVTPEQEDTRQTLVQKFSEAGDNIVAECDKFTMSCEVFLRGVCRGAMDPRHYFAAKFAGVEGWVGFNNSVGITADIFNNFLRAVGHIIGTEAWYDNTKMKITRFVASLASRGFSQSAIDTLMAGVVKKQPRAGKKKEEGEASKGDVPAKPEVSPALSDIKSFVESFATV